MMITGGAICVTLGHKEWSQCLKARTSLGLLKYLWRRVGLLCKSANAFTVSCCR